MLGSSDWTTALGAQADGRQILAESLYQCSTAALQPYQSLLHCVPLYTRPLHPSSTLGQAMRICMPEGWSG